MTTQSQGFYYDRGKKIGYDISMPNILGGRSQLSFVSYKDKARIIREVTQEGVDPEKIDVERREKW